MTPKFHVADRIVYRRTEIGLHPARNARLVAPAKNGDGYSYCVDKYWVVDAVLPDGKLVAKTRRGKLHELNPDDPNLRLASRFKAFWREWEIRMRPCYLILSLLTLIFVVAGYFFFGIVIAISAGLWLHAEKMYYAQGLSAHLFGATGAAIGAALSWTIWRRSLKAFGRRS